MTQFRLPLTFLLLLFVFQPAHAWTEKEYRKLSPAEIKAKLTPKQYEITQGGTERPFDNPYWNNHEAGIYVDVVSGEPLFSSIDKFESGTGWPSFTKPIKAESIVNKDDSSFGMTRTEVRAHLSQSHLGHVFDDGPQPTGLRYCMNSYAMRFIPVAQLKKEGYEEYLPLFSKDKTMRHDSKAESGNPSSKGSRGK